MKEFNLYELKTKIINLFSEDARDPNYLGRFCFFYFLMKNKELERSYIGDIKHFLYDCEIPRQNWQFLDEDIVSFLLGYKILTDISENKEFENKLEIVKKELENHWDDSKKTYFKSNYLTLLILISDNENIHKNDIISHFKSTNDCKLLSLLFIILEENQKKDLNKFYNQFLEKVKHKYHSIPDSEKVYAAWILWKYKNYSKSKKEIRTIVESYISMINGFMDELIKENFDFRVAIYYDLLFEYKKNTRIASEEIPLMYRFLGYFSGIILIVNVLYIDSILWKMGYLQPNDLKLNFIQNAIILCLSGLLFALAAFLIYFIGLQGYYDDEIIKNKFKKLLKYIVEIYVFGIILGVIFAFTV